MTDLRTAAQAALEWLDDIQTMNWQYFDGTPIRDDVIKLANDLRAALAERPAESSECPKCLTEELIDHLNWVGWGDSYERECARASGLRDRASNYEQGARSTPSITAEQPARELSDERILELWMRAVNDGRVNYVVRDFARAVLAAGGKP